MILECPLNILCRVIRSVEVFDFELFLGEMVATYACPAVLTEGRSNQRKVDPMILAYSSISLPLTNACDSILQN